MRFPTWTEFWQTDAMPEVGSTMSRNGSQFAVVARQELPDGVFAFTLAELEAETDDSLEPAFA